MRKQGCGSIVNVTSGSAKRGFIAETAYGPSKYGLEGLTQCLAMELQPYNIAVNTLGVGSPPSQRLKPKELPLEEACNMPGEIRDTNTDNESWRKPSEKHGRSLHFKTLKVFRSETRLTRASCIFET